MGYHSCRSQAGASGGGQPLGDIDAIDGASRGTWGSLLWLARRPNSLRLVTVGAALTVLANAFDVFGQQVVRIDVRSVPDRTQLTRVTRAENVGASFDPVSWLGAVYAGIYSAEIPELPANCASGNCTWGLVPSVGVCGACVDLTPHVPKDWIKCDMKDFGDDRLHCNYTGTVDPSMGEARTVLTSAIPQNAVHAPCQKGEDSLGGSSLTQVATNVIGPGNSTWVAHLLVVIGLDRRASYLTTGDDGSIGDHGVPSRGSELTRTLRTSSTCRYSSTPAQTQPFPPDRQAQQVPDPDP
jgi:hypothetical protein